MSIAKHPLYARFAAAGQHHVLAFYDELSEASRAQLDRQLESLDLDELATLVRREHVAVDWADLARRARPPVSYPSADPATDAITPDAALAAGESALRQGHVAAIIVAGGQGSRLGFEHPKGLFSIGPISGHSLFQILIEKVVSTARRYGRPIPLYVMTSPATHEETVQYLHANQRFGLAEDDLHVFCQGTMPAVDAHTGKLLLAAKDSLALAPDGHGGMLAALQRTGALAHARRRGIEMFSYVQVDNPLAQLCHPQLIGYHLLAHSDMTTQVVRKQDPLERVGNVVLVDGQMRIIEYSDLPEESARGRNADGSLQIWAGSIAVHVFRLGFLEQMVQRSEALEFHVAHKKVAYVDASGTLQNPSQPNAIKFERFIFDLLPWAQQPIVVEGRSEEIFAPVKNAEGAATDTPSATRNALVRLHTRWLEQAGVTVIPGTLVEISPLWAVDAKHAAERITLPWTIDQPTFLTD